MICFASAKSYAQTQVATLQHGDEISAFYGVNALIAANEAAVDGDVITLSSGRFNSTDLIKAITIRGAGVIDDENTLNTPTYVAGDLNIGPNNDDIPLKIEGVYFENTITYGDGITGIVFNKCNIYYLHRLTGIGLLRNTQIVNCIIQIAEIYCSDTTNDLNIINSVIWNANNYQINITFGAVYVYNSIIHYHTGGNIVKNVYHYNSIIGGNGALYNSYSYNCIAVGSSVFSMNTGYNYNCMQVSNYTDIFNSFDGTFAFDADYTLSEAIINSFQGNDGSQVGIYGGAMPYNPRPSYIVPHNTIVSGQSNVDGTLNVEIEVINEEK